MTLSIAWIRNINRETNELLFASDSRLSGGERWDCCPKILPLPRGDAVIAFAGHTRFAYPAMLQVQMAILAYPPLRNRSIDLHKVKTHVNWMFDEMRDEINPDSLPVNQEYPDPPDATFLFGGYSWKCRDFKIWRAEFSDNFRKFQMHSCGRWKAPKRKQPAIRTHDKPELRLQTAGDKEVQGEFKKRLHILMREKYTNQNKLIPGFDYEPLIVLCQMLQERNFDSIGGAPQLVKIFPYMKSQVIGIWWQHKGQRKIFIGGRPLRNSERVAVPILDPETLELSLPPYLYATGQAEKNQEEQPSEQHEPKSV